jgi:hypothetical protein
MLISACPLLLRTFSSAESKWCSTLYVLIYHLDPNLCPEFSLYSHTIATGKKGYCTKVAVFTLQDSEIFWGCRSSTILQQFFRGT